MLKFYGSSAVAVVTLPHMIMMFVGETPEYDFRKIKKSVQEKKQKKADKAAKAAKQGIWAQAKPVAPWKWRKNNQNN